MTPSSMSGMRRRIKERNLHADLDNHHKELDILKSDCLSNAGLVNVQVGSITMSNKNSRIGLITQNNAAKRLGY